MPYSLKATDYHLTVRGWTSGKPPEDRIETWVRASRECRESRISIRWIPIWASPDMPRSERNKIRNRHHRFIASGWDTVVEQPL